MEPLLLMQPTVMLISMEEKSAITPLSEKEMWRMV